MIFGPFQNFNHSKLFLQFLSTAFWSVPQDSNHPHEAKVSILCPGGVHQLSRGGFSHRPVFRIHPFLIGAKMWIIQLENVEAVNFTAAT